MVFAGYVLTTFVAFAIAVVIFTVVDFRFFGNHRFFCNCQCSLIIRGYIVCCICYSINFVCTNINRFFFIECYCYIRHFCHQFFYFIQCFIQHCLEVFRYYDIIQHCVDFCFQFCNFYRFRQVFHNCVQFFREQYVYCLVCSVCNQCDVSCIFIIYNIYKVFFTIIYYTCILQFKCRCCFFDHHFTNRHTTCCNNAICAIFHICCCYCIYASFGRRCCAVIAFTITADTYVVYCHNACFQNITISICSNGCHCMRVTIVCEQAMRIFIAVFIDKFHCNQIHFNYHCAYSCTNASNYARCIFFNVNSCYRVYTCIRRRCCAFINSAISLNTSVCYSQCIARICYTFYYRFHCVFITIVCKYTVIVFVAVFVNECYRDCFRNHYKCTSNRFSIVHCVAPIHNECNLCVSTQSQFFLILCQNNVAICIHTKEDMFQFFFSAFYSTFCNFCYISTQIIAAILQCRQCYCAIFIMDFPIQICSLTIGSDCQIANVHCCFIVLIYCDTRYQIYTDIFRFTIQNNFQIFYTQFSLDVFQILNYLIHNFISNNAIANIHPLQNFDCFLHGNFCFQIRGKDIIKFVASTCAENIFQHTAKRACEFIRDHAVYRSPRQLHHYNCFCTCYAIFFIQLQIFHIHANDQIDCIYVSRCCCYQFTIGCAIFYCLAVYCYSYRSLFDCNCCCCCRTFVFVIASINQSYFSFTRIHCCGIFLECNFCIQFFTVCINAIQQCIHYFSICKVTICHYYICAIFQNNFCRDQFFFC